MILRSMPAINWLMRNGRKNVTVRHETEGLQQESKGVFQFGIYRFCENSQSFCSIYAIESKFTLKEIYKD